MNAWLSWRPDARLALHLRAMLRRAKHMSLTVFSLVGCVAVVTALALWLLPAWRGSFAAKLMPLVSAAVQAGPARLLSGQPFPPFALGHQREEALRNGEGESTSLGAAASDDDSTRKLTGGLSLAVSPNGLDPRTLPTVSTLASAISSQRVVADARDDRVLVSDREQNLVANFIARRYHVAQEPVGELVKAAFDTGREVGLDPLLLLSVMAIESGFNPYAESGVGAQGLMQVMAKVHSDKFQYFGGSHAALEPLANIKVGALVLKDCIARGGSVAGGLRFYVGSTAPDDGGYGAKVLAERARLRDVARGRNVPIITPQAPVQPAPKQVVASASPTSSGTGEKRVHVTLDGAPAITAPSAKLAAPQASDHENTDDADAQTKHVASAEFGA
ncbi:Transglycosylase SLT domain protein [Caballeronia sp. SBC1]|uniref:lytic transglycosylase domain-containing protein n=1 Tax=unclassified Caballeronia TaxID=2646786 RepID=UPI0013E18BAD|nr:MULTISPECIES: lytic transglycosylase domain-containing protein [unclassified Caballeronia]QIE23079.1 Transglycosylase SLT domain protein [Caballeronia sp. SBC2]QIN60973.1 Transglycosylase SLT domain protein [Caballeronia sp. SBC1]